MENKTYSLLANREVQTQKRVAAKLLEDAKQKADELKDRTKELQEALDTKAKALTEAEQRIATLQASLSESAKSLAEALDQVKNHQTMIGGMRANLDESMMACTKAMADLAAEKAVNESISKQLLHEQEMQQKYLEKMDKMMVMISHRPQVTPPTYDMEVVARDGNGRQQRVRLTPAVAK